MSRAPAQPSAISFQQTFALAASFSIGQFGANLAPFVVPALEQHVGTNVQFAGALMSLEFAALFLMALVFLIRGGKWSLPLVGSLGAIAYIAGSLITAFGVDLGVIAAGRVLCGLGSGAAISVANAAAASHDNFRGAFVRAIAGASLITFCLYNIIPGIAEVSGPAAVFFGLAAAGGVLLVPVVALRRGNRQSESPSSHASMQDFSRVVVSGVFLLLVAGLFARLNDGITWSLNARFAEHAGIDQKELGLFLGVLTLACAAAPVIADSLGRRWGYIAIFTAVMAVKTVATYILFVSRDFGTFAFAQSVLFFTFVMVMQLFSGAIAARDASGRFAVVGAMTLMLADVFGPLIAGSAFQLWGLLGVTIAACLVSFAAMICLAGVTVFDRASSTTREGAHARRA